MISGIVLKLLEIQMNRKIWSTIKKRRKRKKKSQLLQMRLRYQIITDMDIKGCYIVHVLKVNRDIEDIGKTQFQLEVVRNFC